MSRRSFIICLLLALTMGTTLRSLWLRADPPTTSVGIVWHDEGAWVHNARNRVQFDTWRTDAWNPVFVAPVFTALEYGAFELFGVGTWQARLVSVVSGLAAVGLLAAGLAAIAGRRVAAFGAALLAVNYIYVMWNRAALMESTMTGFIVAAWAAYALASARPWWGLVAGAAVVLAWFTKAAAAFFVGAIGLEIGWVLATAHVPWLRGVLGVAAPSDASVRAAWTTLAGLAVTAGVIAGLFVLPYWSEYRFYNWQMSVLRKPSYALADLLTRASWIPVVQDFFSRMWLVVLGGSVAIAGILARWRSAAPGERLLVLWVGLGLIELTVHDSGNPRRYVMFVPALVALAALLVEHGRTVLPPGTRRWRAGARWASLPVLLALSYLTAGSLVRILFLEDIAAGSFSLAIRLSAGVAVAVSGALLVWWAPCTRRLEGWSVSPRLAAGLLVLALAWNLGEYVQWARSRTYLNYDASVALGHLLPAGEAVQGKLANGLALENGIRPIFIGNGFGNYDDRFDRDDVRYVLTYTTPALGYESGQDGTLIRDLLDRYPNRRAVATFPVEETSAPDAATLFEKDARD